MASNSGITVVVVVGLLALGASQDAACEQPPEQAPATDEGDDFSFEPAPGAESEAEAGGGPSGAGDDFSFEPVPGAESEAEAGGGPSGAGDDFSFEPAPGAESEAEAGGGPSGAGDDFSFEPESPRA